MFQKISETEKNKLTKIFKSEERSNNDLDYILSLMKTNKIINECYKKANHYINLASNSLNAFNDTKEKQIFKELTSFSLERNF